jgi:predicted lipid carrier protein YhbT
MSPRLARYLTAGRLRRRATLWLVFREMPRYVRQKALEREQAVVEWRLTGRRDGRPDVRQLVIEDGHASVLRGEPREADLELTVSAADLLLLASRDADGGALFLRGELQVDGDPWLAMRLPRFFGRRRGRGRRRSRGRTRTRRR